MDGNEFDEIVSGTVYKFDPALSSEETLSS